MSKFDELMNACQNEDISSVKSILAEKVDVNGKDHENFDMTPLMLAAAMGNIEIANILLDAGAAIDQTDKIGITALMRAAENQDADMVRLLVSRNADIDLESFRGSKASDMTYDETILKILDEAPIERQHYAEAQRQYQANVQKQVEERERYIRSSYTLPRDLVCKPIFKLPSKK